MHSSTTARTDEQGVQIVKKRREVTIAKNRPIEPWSMVVNIEDAEAVARESVII
jgi:hypothetical protein